MPLSFDVLFLLLCIVLPLLLVQAQIVNINVSPVSCPASTTVFRAKTRMVLTGRTAFLGRDERHELKVALMTVYNDLTTANCDANFRKLEVTTFVTMRNSLDETLSTEDILAGASDAITTTSTTGKGRWLQAPLNASAANTSVVPSISLIYDVLGNCRDCQVSDTGSFQLYDDAFRRRFLQPFSGFRNETNTTDDCTCAVGQAPTFPRAPGVNECITGMNEKLEFYRQYQGMYQNLVLTELIQLNDLAGSELYLDRRGKSGAATSTRLLWSIVIGACLLHLLFL